MSDPFAKHFVEHEMQAKAAVLQDTWGHLFPEDAKHGILMFACTPYDYVQVLDEQIDIESSPWWHATITDFAFELYKTEEFDIGDIIKVKAYVTPEQDEEDPDATVIAIYPEKIEKMNLSKDFGWNDITDKILTEAEVANG